MACCLHTPNYGGPIAAPGYPNAQDCARNDPLVRVDRESELQALRSPALVHVSMAVATSHSQLWLRCWFTFILRIAGHPHPVHARRRSRDPSRRTYVPLTCSFASICRWPRGALAPGLSSGQTPRLGSILNRERNGSLFIFQVLFWAISHTCSHA